MNDQTEADRARETHQILGAVLAQTGPMAIPDDVGRWALTTWVDGLGQRWVRSDALHGEATQ